MTYEVQPWRRPRSDYIVGTGEFEFVPDWFLAPREAALASAKLLAHTQMLCSFVAERRSGE